MFRSLFYLLLTLVPAAACLWDRDTWREEAKGRIDTLKAITGWFDRYPPRYYEMRLERVTRELESKPAEFDLYDDAGVACNRLGRYDEAIAWMARKKAMLDATPSTVGKMDRYRYHANLGSFLGNRWAVRPPSERKGDITDLVAATHHIAEAIELNPDAHFGREKYQLKLFQWLQREAEQDGRIFAPEQNFLGVAARNRIGSGGLEPHPELHDAESGLIGLIHLGSAWESIDVFDALGTLVQLDGASSLSLLVEMRLRELEESGHRSLHPAESHQRNPHGLLVQSREPLEEWYQDARRAAKARGEAWVAYQTGRFERGMHPDTHPEFWRDWEEREFPDLPGPSLVDRAKANPGLSMSLFFLAISLGAVGLYHFLNRRACKDNLTKAPTS